MPNAKYNDAGLKGCDVTVAKQTKLQHQKASSWDKNIGLDIG